MKFVLKVEDGVGTITVEGLEALCFELPDCEEEVELPVEETPVMEEPSIEIPIEEPTPIIEDTLPGVEELPVIDPIIDVIEPAPIEELPVVEEEPIVEPLPSEIGADVETFPELIVDELPLFEPVEEPALVAVPPEVPVKEEITGETNTPEILTTDNVLVPAEETKVEEEVIEPIAVDAPIGVDAPVVSAPIGVDAPVVEPPKEEVKEESAPSEVEAVLINKEDLTSEQLPLVEDLVTMSDELVESDDSAKKDKLIAELQELVAKLSK